MAWNVIAAAQRPRQVFLRIPRFRKTRGMAIGLPRCWHRVSQWPKPARGSQMNA